MRFHCTVCGYIYEGDAVPNQCPVCKSDAFKEETLYILTELRCSQQLIQEMQKLRQTDIVEYELKMSQFRTQYDNKIAMQIQAQQRQATQQSQNRPKCPTCGSTNIEKISAGKKLAGSMLFGLFSSDVRNTMHCKDCGTKW